MNSRVSSTIAAFAFTLLVGHITDRTTGQPLTGVHVEIVQGQKTLRATSDADGTFHVSGVQPGKHTLRYSSDDVPPKAVSITVSGRKQQLQIAACSTTLDYSCGGGGF